MAARITFPGITDDAIAAVGRLFGVEPTIEPYTPDGTPVYRVTPTGKADGVRLTLWPSLRRVDVSSAGDHAWVLKDVGEVEIVPGVEVIFRPAGVEGFLFVAVNGWVNIVIG